MSEAVAGFSANVRPYRLRVQIGFLLGGRVSFALIIQIGYRGRLLRLHPSMRTSSPNEMIVSHFRLESH